MPQPPRRRCRKIRSRRSRTWPQAKANLDLNKSIVKSRKQLFAEGAIPGRDLDTAEAALVQAQAAYCGRQASGIGAQCEPRGSAQSGAGATQFGRRQIQGRRGAGDYSEIRSPINGVVTDRPLFAGETASAGTPLITVMDTSELLAKTHMAQALALELKVGDAAPVHVPGSPDPVPAKVP